MPFTTFRGSTVTIIEEMSSLRSSTTTPKSRPAQLSLLPSLTRLEEFLSILMSLPVCGKLSFSNWMRKVTLAR